VVKRAAALNLVGWIANHTKRRLLSKAATGLHAHILRRTFAAFAAARSLDFDDVRALIPRPAIGTYRYYLTKAGRVATAAAERLTNAAIIPSMI
jgi:hypothetical protein